MASATGDAAQNPWEWSADHRNYYKHEYKDNKWNLIWYDPNDASSSANKSQRLEPGDASRSAQIYTYDAPTGGTGNSTPSSAHATVGHPVRQSHGGGNGGNLPFNALSAGADEGLRERLHPDYYEQPNPNSFFVPGRLIALLFTEPYSERTANSRGRFSNITWVRFGERVHTQIRRFIVVENRRSFCYALYAVALPPASAVVNIYRPISTYGGRATTKPGVDPREHSVVYSSQSPYYLPTERGITNPPIRVIMHRQDTWLDPLSRLNFGMQVPIQHNVKVRNLGMVADEDQPNLYAYWQLAQRPH